MLAFEETNTTERPPSLAFVIQLQHAPAMVRRETGRLQGFEDFFAEIGGVVSAVKRAF